MPNPFPMPMSSWSTVKQIIRAYGQVENEEKPTVDQVADIADIPRPMVSANNNFLREIGVVSKEGNKPTPLGSRLAACLVMENESLIAEALQELVHSNSHLNQWVGMIRARGVMKFEHLKGTLALAAGIADKGKQTGPAKAVLDMLQEAKLIQVTDDTIRPVTNSDSSERIAEEVRLVEKMRPAFEGQRAVKTEQASERIPLPLGPTRLAYIQLPNDWHPKELTKLIKILQIALGEDEAA